MRVFHLVRDGVIVKGKLHVFDVLGLALSRSLGAGTALSCTFKSPTGDEFTSVGKVNFEMALVKPISGDVTASGGSMVFETWPPGKLPVGWELQVEVPE